MAALSLLAILLLGFLKLCSACPGDETYPGYPSHGDIRLCAGGLVMIYKGPDRTNIPHMWGTLRGTFRTPSVAHTLCRQLGYDDGNIFTMDTSKTLNSKYPVWLTNISCPEGGRHHILRCNDYHLYSDTEAMHVPHDIDMFLNCSTFSTRDRPKGNQNTYVGQVALQPPDTLALAKYNYSRSFGVVTVKVAESKNGWQYVWKNKSPFDYDDADTVCRAMGYTHAVKNSVMTATQYQLTLNWTFHNLNKIASLGANKQVNCTKSCPCFGCCANLSQSQNDADHELDVNPADLAVVVLCSFYKPYYDTLISGGSKSDCEVGKNGDIRNLSQCTQNKSPRMISLEEREFIAVVAAPVGVVLLVAFGIVGVVIGYKKVEAWKRRRGYQRVRNGNGGNGGDGNGGHGNGGRGNGGHGNGGNGGDGNGGNGGDGNGGNGGGL